MKKLLHPEMKTDVAHFKKHGFSDVKKFITTEMIEKLRAINENTKSNSAFDSFKRNTYNVGIDNENVRALVQSDMFARFVATLGYGDCVFTDGIIFRTDATSVGFDWHIGVTSFKYIYPEDSAFSIWIPLDPVDPEGQDGGMTLLSTSTFSGREFYKLQSVATKSLTEGKYKIPAIYKTVLGPKYRTESQKKFKALYPFIQEQFPHLFSESLYISGFARNLFDSEGVKYKLEPGDAIVFDKDTFHKSNKFHSGPQASRRAFVLRFVGTNARYNEVNAKKTAGDLSVLVNRIARSNGKTFDLVKALVVRVKGQPDVQSARQEDEA